MKAGGAGSDRGQWREEGSEVVAHVLVQGLIIMVVLALMQIAFALHTRNVVTSAAGEGARRAALMGASLADGTERVHQLLDQTLGVSGDAHISTHSIMRAGQEMIEVRITTAIPILLTWGPAGSLTVSGHALKEVHYD